MKEEERSPLRLLRGGLDYQCICGKTHIGVVPLEAPSPPLDAVVVEQDTHCLLAVESELELPGESLAQLGQRMEAFVPYRGGEVVVRQGEPLQLYAIVHDLDETPSWREGWIDAALDRVLAIAAQRRLQRLGMPLLGSVHGRFVPERFIELLLAAVARGAAGPQQIWLGVARRECERVIAYLRLCCPSPTER